MTVRKLWIGVALVAVVALAACSGQRADTPRTAPGTTLVKAAVVKRGDLTSALSYTGDVRSRAQVAVVPEVTGRVEKLAVDVGTTVQAGDLLAELDTEALKAQQAQARAALGAAEARLAGMRRGARAEAVAARRSEKTLAPRTLNSAAYR